MTPTFDHEASLAEQALKEAQKTNRQTGEARQGISANQAEILLRWMVSRTRKRIYDQDAARAALPSYEEFFQTPDLVFGSCGYAQGSIAFYAEAMSIDSVTHQAQSFSDGHRGQGHAFNVLTLPIKDDGGHVDLRSYLVDATFAQFMTSLEYSDGTKTVGWGPQLCSTPEGKTLAESLLNDGFAPLTPQSAQLYLGSGRFRKITGDNIPEPIDKLWDRLAKKTVVNDYSLQDFVETFGADMRTPDLIEQGAPLDSIFLHHPDGPQAGHPAEESGKSKVPPPLKNRRVSTGPSPKPSRPSKPGAPSSSFGADQFLP